MSGKLVNTESGRVLVTTTGSSVLKWSGSEYTTSFNIDRSVYKFRLNLTLSAMDAARPQVSAIVYLVQSGSFYNADRMKLTLSVRDAYKWSIMCTENTRYKCNNNRDSRVQFNPIVFNFDKPYPPDMGFLFHYGFVNTSETSSPSMASLNLNQVFYDELKVKPDEFGLGSNRFSLRSNEGDCFYVHTFVMERLSQEISRVLKRNHDGILDGNPLPVDCSTLALSALLDLVYLQKVSEQLNVVLSAILRVAHLWQMHSILNLCVTQMKHSVHNKLNKDFDSLLDWFVLAARFEIKDEESLLEKQILAQIMHLAKTQAADKKELIQAQLAEYIKDKSTDQVASLMIKLNELNN